MDDDANVTALLSLAEFNERLANHMEESKRVYAHIELLEAHCVETKTELRELRTRLAQVAEFHQELKRIGLMVVTGGAIVLWWIVQKLLEHGR